MSAVAESITVPLPTLAERREDIAAALDALPTEAQVNWIRGLSGRQLGALYALSQGSTLKASEFVRADGQVTICEGKNGLPLFTNFQKRFARLGDQIVGYNHNPAFQTFFVGPGHFVFEDSPDVPGETWVNYCKVPEARHPEFPELVPNENLFTLPAPFARWTYGDMIDIVRRVSRQVVIGFSVKPSGNWGPNAGQYFALVLPQAQ